MRSSKNNSFLNTMNNFGMHTYLFSESIIYALGSVPITQTNMWGIHVGIAPCLRVH